MNEGPKGHELEVLLRKGIEKKCFPGGVACVIKRGEILARAAAGQRMVVPEKLPVEWDTLFDLASVTKPVATATALLLLVNERAIDLDQPVRSYLPSFDREGVTVRHLATHTSGVRAWRRLYSAVSDPCEIPAYLARCKLQHAPGSQVVYSCLGYILLGFLIAEVVGESLAAFLDRKVFGPLGMVRAKFCPDEEERLSCAAAESLASAHKRGIEYEMRRWYGGVIVGEVHDENAHFQGGISGNAGLFASLGDLEKYCSAFLRREGPFGTKVFDLAWENQTKGRNAGRTIGWSFVRDGVIYHTGYTGTSVRMYRDTEAAVILLTNRVHPDAQNMNIAKFREDFHSEIETWFDLV